MSPRVIAANAASATAMTARGSEPSCALATGTITESAAKQNAAARNRDNVSEFMPHLTSTPAPDLGTPPSEPFVGGSGLSDVASQRHRCTNMPTSAPHLACSGQFA